MNNKEFIEHCIGLTVTMKEKNVIGFYYLINGDDPKCVLSSVQLDQLSSTEQNIFDILDCLPKASPELKVLITEGLQILVNASKANLESDKRRNEHD
ncbi:MAG: hypothetical protein ACC707_14875 [Thiohalomonadales bacterium]